MYLWKSVYSAALLRCNMVIRVGILAIPTHDEEVVAALMQLLHSELRQVVLLQNSAVGDQRNWVEETLRRWSDDDELDLLLTVGGTAPAAGPSGRQVVPKAMAALIERPLPGLAEAMRSYAADHTPLAWLDAGVAGIRGYSLLVNLPAGATAASLFLEAIADLIEPLLLQLHHSEQAPTLASAVDQLAVPDEDERSERRIRPSSTSDEPTAGGLDPAEFAEFLQRRQKPS